MSRSIEPYNNPVQVAKNLRRWHEAMELSHAMLMAGLRDQVGPNGDLRQAYREWQEQNRVRKMRAYKRAARRYFEQQDATRGKED